MDSFNLNAWISQLSLTAFDYIVLLILVLSALLGLLRGLVKELLSLLGWVLSFVAANAFAGDLAGLLPTVIPGELVRLLLAFIAIFVVCMLILTLARKALAELVRVSGLGGADRVIGMLFGVGRGLLIVWTLAILAGMTALPQQSVWRQAWLSPYVESSLRWMKPYFPAAVADKINF